MRSITCRGVRAKKAWSIAIAMAMLVSSGGPMFDQTVKAQTAPVGAGFNLNAGDLRFIFRQIQIAQAHSAGGQLFGSGPNQIPDVRLPFGLRAVDGSNNHLAPGTTLFGAASHVGNSAAFEVRRWISSAKLSLPCFNREVRGNSSQSGLARASARFPA